MKFATIRKCLIDLAKKYKSVILYVFWGVMTTLVNIGAFFLLYHVATLSLVVSNLIAWFISVLFAYITNRKMVFNSSAKGIGPVLLECSSFFAGRLATGLLDTFLMFIFVDVLSFNDFIVKIMVNVLIIILNYVIPKFPNFYTYNM